MKKYLYTPLFFIFGIVSLFLFPEIGHCATNYDYTLVENQLKLIEDNYEDIQTMIATADTTFPSKNYAIIHNGYQTNKWRVVSPDNATTAATFPNYRCSSNQFYTAGGTYYFNSNYTTLTRNGNESGNFTYLSFYSTPNYNDAVIIYAKSGIFTASSFIDTTSSTFTYDNKTFTYTCGADAKFPTLLELYEYYNAPPPNPTPLLTNYYALIIQKIGVLATYFADNPYMYAIPLIPIFLLCIYLIKRSLIK